MKDKQNKQNKQNKQRKETNGKSVTLAIGPETWAAVEELKRAKLGDVAGAVSDTAFVGFLFGSGLVEARKGLGCALPVPADLKL